MAYEECYVEAVKHTTDKAALCVIDGAEQWVPFSVIEENGKTIDEDFTGALFIARWFCDKEGIDY